MSAKASQHQHLRVLLVVLQSQCELMNQSVAISLKWGIVWSSMVYEQQPKYQTIGLLNLKVT